MINFKLILKSIAVVAPFFVAIVVIDILTDKINILQGEYAPLWYVLPVMAILAAYLIIKSRW